MYNRESLQVLLKVVAMRSASADSYRSDLYESVWLLHCVRQSNENVVISDCRLHDVVRQAGLVKRDLYAIIIIIIT